MNVTISSDQSTCICNGGVFRLSILSENNLKRFYSKPESCRKRGISQIELMASLRMAWAIGTIGLAWLTSITNHDRVFNRMFNNSDVEHTLDTLHR